MPAGAWDLSTVDSGQPSRTPPEGTGPPVRPPRGAGAYRAVTAAGPLQKKRHGGGSSCRSAATVGFFLMRGFMQGQRRPGFLNFCVASERIRIADQTDCLRPLGKTISLIRNPY
jgi:hypothetical protein